MYSLLSDIMLFFKKLILREVLIMDDKIKEKLEAAANSGKDAVENLKHVVKNITKDVVEKSKNNESDLKENSEQLLKELLMTLKSLGKDSIELIKAATSGVIEGVKESANKDNNFVGSFFSALGSSLKSLGEAGVYVTTESAKSLYSMVNNEISKHKEKVDKDNNSNEDDEIQ